MSNRRPRWITLPLWTLGLALIVATLLPFLNTNAGWVRIFDFPRMQFAALLVIALAGALLLLRFERWSVRWFAAALLLALSYQIFRILPFTPLVDVEAVGAPTCAEPSRIRLLIANVLASNRRSEPLLAMVRDVDPDIVLLMEADAWWDRQLAALQPAYPFIVAQPQEDTYGIHLFSRFELVDPEVRFLLDDYVPSITTGVQLRSGAIVDLHGVHPKPPRPFHGTARRDAELILVAREVHLKGIPAIVAGDLNDVAWSQTNRLFQQVSGLLDPRIGRGLFPTFNANWPLLRWPLDHVFFASSFGLVALTRMGHIGSDHFPIVISLCHSPRAAARQDEPEAGPADRRNAQEAIEQGKKKGQVPPKR